MFCFPNDSVFVGLQNFVHFFAGKLCLNCWLLTIENPCRKTTLIEGWI